MPVRPSAVTASAAGHPELGVTAQYRHPVTPRPRAAARRSDAGGSDGVARADGVEQPDRGRAHRRQVVDVDQHRAPAGPLRFAFDHGRDDGVAGGDEVAAGHGAPSSPTKPGPGRRRARRNGARAAPSEDLVAAATGRIRPSASASARAVAGDLTVAPAASRAAEQRLVCRLHRRVETQHARRLGAGAGGADESRRRLPRPRAPAATASLRPSTSRGRARPDGAESHAADDGAVPRAGHQDDGARIVVVVVEVVAVEQALVVDEDLAGAARYAPRAAASSASSMRKPGRRARVLRSPSRARMSSGRSLTGAGAVSPPSSHMRHPPAVRSTLHAPQAAQPAFWSAPLIPAARSFVGDLPGDVRERPPASGAPTPSTAASVPRIGRNGTTNGYTPRLDQPARAGDQFVGVLAEPDQEVRRDPVGPEDAHGLVPGRLVLRHRDGRLAGHPAPAYPSSRASTWMPMAVAPGVVELADPGQVAGGSHCTWMGRPGTASSTARTQRARCGHRGRARRWCPVVITICRTPSSRTAASATSASCAGVLAATVAPERERLLDGAEAAAVGLGVADAGLHDGGGEHVRAVQPGDLLVRDAVGGRAGRRTSAAAPGPRESPVSCVAEPDRAVADRVGAAGVGGKRGVGTVDEDVAVVARARAVRSPEGNRPHAVEGELGAGVIRTSTGRRAGANAHAAPPRACRWS